MSADFPYAVLSLQENLRLLNGNRTVEQSALWNMSNALLVVCDALAEIDAKVKAIEVQTRKAR